jgi:hypothetical protein
MDSTFSKFYEITFPHNFTGSGADEPGGGAKSEAGYN